jgi:acyl carrier protein
MSEGEIEAFLYEQLAQQWGKPLAAVYAQVGGSGEIDSLQGLELTLVIEERYGIHLADDELTSKLLRSIPRPANIVASKVADSTRK